MKHIMMMDRDAELYLAAKQALSVSYEIIPLPENNDLTEYFTQNTADAVFLTVSDNDTSSFHTFERLMQLPALTGKPIAFLARQGSLLTERKAISLGAQDYIIMPDSPELLLHKVKQCMELAELRLEDANLERFQDVVSLSFAELVECRDVTTGGHLKNTTMYFKILLKEALTKDGYQERVSAEDARDLLRSVSLHDIGKIGINDEVLRKESALEFNEYEYMKTHTTLGKEAFDKIIKETGGARWLYLARDMAYCHHERWDGSGYPNGLKGGEIPFYARMLTVVDVYDALTSNRAYKEAYTHQRAVEIILQGKGTMFDPDLVDLFMQADKKFENALNHKYDSEIMERV